MIETIQHEELHLATIVRAGHESAEIEFLTPNDYSQQLGLMRRPAGTKIASHRHRMVSREVTRTQEVLIIRSGKIRVDFYVNDGIYLSSRILETGDIILLAGGGHGFEVLENVDMIEIKQGPYAGDQDKETFPPVAPDKLRFD